MEQILKTSQLSKYFYQKKALDKIDLTIEKGEIYGIGRRGKNKQSF